MKRPFLAALLVISAMMISACQKIPDPCAGYRLACIAVTVEDGPAATFQLSVNVEGFGSTTPLTPRAKPDEPLTYPLRFAVKFRAFEDNLPPPDQVTVRVQALDLQNTIVGFALAIHDLTDEGSILLQESGLGGRRRMGCGFFQPITLRKENNR